MSVTRLLVEDDAPAVAELLRENRGFLAPWQPRRPDAWFTDAGQLAVAQRSLEDHSAGRGVPMVVLEQGAVVGTISLQTVVRGALQSCSVGYWLAESAQGRGLATAALREAVDVAFGELRLHRVQAETLLDNTRSQRVLERVGFVRYGVAPDYLQIDGRWQANALHQLITPTPELVVTG